MVADAAKRRGGDVCGGPVVEDQGCAGRFGFLGFWLGF